MWFRDQNYRCVKEVGGMVERGMTGENMMEWINIFGTVFIMVIMVPNIVFALKCREGFKNDWKQSNCKN